MVTFDKYVGAGRRRRVRGDILVEALAFNATRGHSSPASESMREERLLQARVAFILRRILKKSSDLF